MKPIKVGNVYNGVIMRTTYTMPADDMDDFLSKITDNLSKEYEWVDVSNSYPIISCGALNYTVTVTAGNLH